jgi:hypothetical protein
MSSTLFALARRSVNSTFGGGDMIMKATQVLLVITIICCPIAALADSSSISGPEIGFPDGVNQEDIIEVISFLNAKAEFKHGEFFNEHTFSCYAAPTPVLSEVIKLLATKGRLHVTVCFARLKKPDISFTTYQRTSQDFRIAVNLDFTDVDLEKLTIAVEQPPGTYSSGSADVPTEKSQEQTLTAKIEGTTTAPIEIEIGDGVTVSGPDFAVPLEVREKKKRPEGLKTIDRSDQPTVHARHILVLVPAGSDESVKMQSLAEVERIRAALIAGADFEMTAKQHSACPSKERGGDLGSFRRGQMVKPFEEAAFSQKVGKIGPIVYTKFGYHIIQVLDRQHE